MNETLTETERLTFGALLGALIRMDGYTTPEGQEATVQRVARDLLPGDPCADMADAVAALLERPAERYPDAESVLRFTGVRDALLTASRVLTPAAAFLQIEGGDNAGIIVDGGDISKAAKPLALREGGKADAVKLRI